ncbi:PREDICTED: uncharacterized protein LOC109131190 [Camelina sativa]|uniref:Uncharacterized protein LOC109131190 n=1 Tax=Camelina sativa TaxID=90675 RepID=A0ABM1REI1_CAMSA|nr:PREDICTED: uncharacterized protein LOC109131190 [Camelina sativa]
MLAARPLLLSGSRKNIGSGFDTRVWSDPWISSIPARPALSKLDNTDPNLFVNALIDPVSKSWKVELLHELIQPEDIPRILGLHPSSKFSRDAYVWTHTKSGNYSVKSGYLAASASRRGDCGLPFQGPSVSALQAQSWKIPTSRKIKHFLWQSVSGCLVTCQRLVNRHLATDRLCPRCGMEEESINHVLFECPPAFQVWSLSQIPFIQGVFPSSSLFVNIDHLFWRARELGGREESIRIFPWILWFIWKARNSKVFENKDVHPADTLQLAMKEADSFRTARVKDSFLESAPPLVPLEVPVPVPGSIVCQVDGSWALSSTLSGIGWVANSGQDIIHLGLKGFRSCQLPLHAEFEALLWEMRSLISLSLFHVDFQTDSLELSQLLDTPDEWPAFSLELEYISMLKLSFFFFFVFYFTLS